MYIQYIGFNLAANSRIYNFDVIDKAAEAREFTVKVQSEAFRPAHLKIQDGPDICFERLERELERETKESRVEAHLSIGKGDIQEYLEGHYPLKAHSKKTASYGSQSSRITGTSGANLYRVGRA
jgi:hypothetical protein